MIGHPGFSLKATAIRRTDKFCRYTTVQLVKNMSSDKWEKMRSEIWRENVIFRKTAAEIEMLGFDWTAVLRCCRHMHVLLRELFMAEDSNVPRPCKGRALSLLHGVLCLQPCPGSIQLISPFYNQMCHFCTHTCKTSDCRCWDLHVSPNARKQSSILCKMEKNLCKMCRNVCEK